MKLLPWRDKQEAHPNGHTAIAERLRHPVREARATIERTDAPTLRGTLIGAAILVLAAAVARVVLGYRRP